MKFIKNFFLKLIPAKKYSWVLFFIVSFFSLLVPFHFAQAFWGRAIEIVFTLFAGLPILIVSLILQLVLGLSVLFSAVSAMLLKWVIYLQIPLTKCPDGVDCIVNFGWEFSRDLANMFFILVLVAIAFAYILKVETFGMKKALPMLIIVALLVNFSQVFVGIIVDIAQIIMNTFVNALDFSNILNQLKGWGGNIMGAFRALVTADMTKQIEFLVQTLVIIVFNLAMGVMLLLYSFLFIVRIIALWVLTMLAPLAFVALILPMTKKYWDKWLGQVLSWSFLGVTALFFLFFGFYLLGGILTHFGTGGFDIDDVGFGATAIIQSILPYIVVLVFLFIGFQLAISSAPAGAKLAMDLGKKAGGWAMTRRPVALGLGKLAGGTAGMLGKAAPAIQRLEQFAGKAPGGKYWGKALRPTGWAFRGIERAAAPALLEYAAKKRRWKPPSEFDDMSPEEQKKYIEALALATDKLIAFARAAEKGTLQKMDEGTQTKAAVLAEKYGEDPHYKKEAGDIYDVLTKEVTMKGKIALEPTIEDKEKMKKDIEGVANEISAQVKLEADLPEEERKVTKEVEERAMKKYKVPKEQLTEQMKERTIEDIAAGAAHGGRLKSGKIGDVAKGSVKSLAFRWGMHSQSSAARQALVANFDPETVKNVYDETGGLNQIFEAVKDKPEEQKEILERLYRKDPTSLKWFFTTPAGRNIDFAGRDIIMRKVEEGGYGGIEGLGKTVKEKEEARKRAAAAPPERVPPELLTQRGEIKSDIRDLDEEIEEITTERMKAGIERNNLADRIKEYKGPTAGLGALEDMWRKVDEKCKELEQRREALKGRKSELEANLSKLEKGIKKAEEEAARIEEAARREAELKPLSAEEEKIFKNVIEKGRIPKSPQKIEQAVNIIKRKLTLTEERGKTTLDELKGVLTEMETKGITGKEYDVVKGQYEGVKENMERIKKEWTRRIEELGGKKATPSSRSTGRKK